MTDRSGRMRRQVKTWLNVNHPEQAALYETVQMFIEQGEFSQVFREAMTLYISLLNGDLSILKTLFPGIEDAIQPPILVDPEDTLLTELTHIKAIISGQLAVVQSTPTSTADDPKMNDVPPVAAPDFDDDWDDDIHISITKTQNTESASNFLKSLASLAGETNLENMGKGE